MANRLTPKTVALPLPGGEESPIANAAFLSPGQGERWLAKQAGEGVLASFASYLHLTRNRDIRIAVTIVSSAVATITSAM
jgi:hypothetical protein